jgi:hypothetical protein
MVAENAEKAKARRVVLEAAIAVRRRKEHRY